MRKISLKNIVYTYFFSILILILSLLIIENINVINNNMLVIFTFLINGGFITNELFKTNKLGYSLKEIIFLFLFLFMFYSPLVQYLSDYFPWWDVNLITDSIIIYTNFIVLLFILVYKLMYLLFSQNTQFIPHSKNKELRNIPFILDFFFILSILVTLYIVSATGFANLFSRSTNTIAFDNQSLSLIIQNTFKSVPIFYVALNIIYLNKYGKIYKTIPFLVGTVFMLLINFPTATPRFWMASTYLGFLIIIIKRMKNPHIFKVLILGGIFLVFPFLNIFRYNTLSDIFNININIPNVVDAFLTGDFDSYSMLSRAIIYSDLNNITWGYQLIGNILFFIPRSIWPSKPIGSGAMIATFLNWPFSNVSMPYIGEGYINFGLVGVILFAIILAFITAKTDFTYYKNISTGIYSIINLVYPFSVGFIFFILRGDLLSSLSFYIGFMVPVILIALLNRINFVKFLVSSKQ